MDKGFPAPIHKGDPMPKQHPSRMRGFSEALLLSKEAVKHSRARWAGRVVLKQECADTARNHGNASLFGTVVRHCAESP